MGQSMNESVFEDERNALNETTNSKYTHPDLDSSDSVLRIIDINPSTAPRNPFCDCGARLDPTTARFCAYFGRYFCPSCHRRAQRATPSRCVRHWDATAAPVAETARALIDRDAHKPLFNMKTLAPRFYGSLPELKAITVRLCFFCRCLISACFDAFVCFCLSCKNIL